MIPAPSDVRSRWLSLVVVTVVAGLLPLLPPVESVDLAFFDRQTAWLRALAPVGDAPEVAVVGIDEGTVAAFPEPMALWHPHLGRLFEALAAAEPAAVGLDVNLPGRSYDFLVPGSDRHLLEGILALRRVAPLVLALSVEADGEVRPIYPPFASLAGEEGTGYVLWDLDRDRVVRRFSEHLGDDGSAVATLVGRLTAALGAETTEGLIDGSRGRPFSYHPVQEVIAWHEAGDIDRLRAAFAARPVLVGSVLPFVDRHYQPVDLAAWEDNRRFVPGVLIHAQTLRAQLGGWMIRPLGVWLTMLLCVAFAQLWWLAARPAVGLAVLVAASAGWAALSTAQLRQGLWLPLGSVVAAAAVGVAGRVVSDLLDQARERRRLRGAFAGYVSPEVLGEILAGRLEPGLGGRRRRVCVLFSDIRGFTTLSEGLEPEAVIGLLNRYFEQWTAAIRGQQGTVDKFIGDGIMAFFGAPQDSPDPARAGLDAAVDMLHRLAALNRELGAEGRPELTIGIGLHLGEAVIGHVGGSERHEYTAIGDTVNVASRLEGLTKDLDAAIACSREVAEALGGDGFESVGERTLKGHTPMEVLVWRGEGSAREERGR